MQAIDNEAIKNSKKTQRWVLTISYDGNHFCGWQKQISGVATVQESLEQSLSTLACEKISVIVAGRTDTGVHATNQVVHFDTTAIRHKDSWIRGVNTNLPKGIAVINAQKVDPQFHARFDATGRHYRYVLETSAVRSPLLCSKVGWIHTPLDIHLMQSAAKLLIGEHDFSSFRASECQAKTPIKTLYYLSIQERKGLFIFDFHGNAFLHHMIRNIIGALIYIGNKRLKHNEFIEIFAAKNRTKAPPTFMADGLYFTGVDYPEKYHIQKIHIPSWLW